MTPSRCSAPRWKPSPIRAGSAVAAGHQRRARGLSPALAALLLTLADPDTPVWLPAGRPAPARAFLRFHCGCPLVDQLDAATFVCVPAGHAMPALADCAQGQPAYPNRSATLIVEWPR